ncbi:MAG TPA: 50S ribosomal protein L25/general stress protein Ctc [Deltaproteobacteria bacterium]|nr:50S ribosomal protein L25/general stress protein Ctc [Deltaproteobacteria bacterium]
MEITDLTAQVRTEHKKGPARRLRQSGFVPAVFYGRSTENLLLAVKNDALDKIRKDKKDNSFIKLIIDDGKKKIEKLSLIKELQVQPLTGKFYHADFYEIDMKHKLTVDVTLQIVGKPVGVDNGGELQHIKRDVKVSCLPNDMPDHIDIDVTGLDIGDSLKIRDIAVPDGVTILDPPDAAVVAVAVMRVAKLEEAAPEEAAAEEGAAAEGTQEAPAADESAGSAQKDKTEKDNKEK